MKDNECRKITTGYCTGCPALQLCERLIANKLPPVEAIDYVKDTVCPSGHEPEYTRFITKAGVVVYRALDAPIEL